MNPFFSFFFSSEVCSFVGRYVDLIYLGRAGTNIRSRFGATQIRPNNPTKVRLAQQGGFLSYLARGGLHVEPAASVWSGMDALAAAASLSTFRSATDDNALDELARPQGRVAASRVEGHFPADEVLPAHENGHGGGATLSDAEVRMPVCAGSCQPQNTHAHALRVALHSM